MSKLPLPLVPSQWADAGSVLFNFERQGVIRVNKGISEDEVFPRPPAAYLRATLDLPYRLTARAHWDWTGQCWRHTKLRSEKLGGAGLGCMAGQEVEKG